MSSKGWANQGFTILMEEGLIHSTRKTTTLDEVQAGGEIKLEWVVEEFYNYGLIIIIYLWINYNSKNYHF